MHILPAPHDLLVLTNDLFRTICAVACWASAMAQPDLHIRSMLARASFASGHPVFWQSQETFCNLADRSQQQSNAALIAITAKPTAMERPIWTRQRRSASVSHEHCCITIASVSEVLPLCCRSTRRGQQKAERGGGRACWTRTATAGPKCCDAICSPPGRRPASLSRTCCRRTRTSACSGAGKQAMVEVSTFVMVRSLHFCYLLPVEL